MKHEPVNFANKLGKFNDHWSPRVIAEMNDYQFKLAKVEVEFVWHDHPDTDETFIVLDGELRIDFRDGEVTLKTGEMYVIPKGVEHRLFAEKEAKSAINRVQGRSKHGGCWRGAYG